MTLDTQFKSSAEQRACVAGLTQGTAAWLIGISDAHLRKQKDAPRNEDGSYDGRELVAWVLAKRATSVDSSGETALDKVRRELLELRLSNARAETVPVDEVREAYDVIGETLKGAGHKLQRKFGAGAQDILDQAIDAILQECAYRFGAPAKAKPNAKARRK